MQLEGTVALVTGGAKRVGRAIVLELAGGGCDVGIHYHTSRDEAERLAAEVADLGRRAVTIRADLNDPACWAGIVEETVSRLERLDILVNNAAIFPGHGSDGVEAFDPDLWERIHRINLLAPMALSRFAKGHLDPASRFHRSRDSGCIINLCDAASDRPGPGHLGYFASKAALAALTKGLARAMAPGVRVNGVAPGIAVFPDDYDEETRRRLTDVVPLKREGSPKDVAKAVRFLVEHGDYITGEIMAVDGGRSLQ